MESPHELIGQTYEDYRIIAAKDVSNNATIVLGERIDPANTEPAWCTWRKVDATYFLANDFFTFAMAAKDYQRRCM